MYIYLYIYIIFFHGFGVGVWGLSRLRSRRFCWRWSWLLRYWSHSSHLVGVIAIVELRVLQWSRWWPIILGDHGDVGELGGGMGVRELLDRSACALAPWCSSYCLRASACRCLFVQGLGFFFFFALFLHGGQ